MIRLCLFAAATVAVAVALLACGNDGGASAGKGAGQDRSGSQGNVTFQLDALPEIDEEFRVLPHQVRAEEFVPVDGETYAMTGRIKTTRDGLFAVMLVDDTKVQYNELMARPWEYCCASPEAVAANAISVRFVREGNTMPESITATNRPSYRLLDLITVVGTIDKDSESGAVVFHATGYVLEQRPEYDHVQWPEA